MATKKALEVGISLGATDDGASEVIDKVARRGESRMEKFMGGLGGGYAASKGFEAIGEMKDKYAGQEYSLASLRILEMDRMGTVNEQVYQQEEDFVKKLSNTYAKTVEEYANMAVVLRQNRVSSDDLLGGIGDTTAQLGKVFDNMEPRLAGLFFARLKSDLRVDADEMGRLADMAYRLKQVGVGGGDANKTIHELTEAYGVAGLGAVNLGLKGAKDAEEVGVLMGTFIAKGISGATVGTNFRRIFDGIRDPERMGKVIKNAKKFGVGISLFDSKGDFKGLRNFETEMAKLKTLTGQQRALVLKPFTGKQGLSTDFLEYISGHSEDVEEIRKQYEAVTSMHNAVNEILKTQKIGDDKLKSSKDNLWAAFGKSIAPDVKRLNEFLTDTNHWLTEAVEHNPDISKMAIEFGAVGLAVGGIYSGLVAVGAYLPVVAGLAAGLAGSVAGIFGAVASLMIWKEFMDSDEAKKEQVEMAPESEKTRLIKGYDEIINDPNTGWFKRFMAKTMQASIVRNTQFFGDYSEGSNNQAKGYGFLGINPDEMTPPKGMKDYNYGWRPPGYVPSKTAGYENNSGQMSWNGSSFTYSPNISLGDVGALNKEDVEGILKENSEQLYDTLQQIARRKNNLNYGRNN